MNKEKYECTALEVIAFKTEDILKTSGYDENEGWNPYDPGGSRSDEYEGWNPY